MDKKPKLYVPPYQVDRKSKDFELVIAKQKCPFCGSYLSDYVEETGGTHTWCFNCKAHFNHGIVINL